MFCHDTNNSIKTHVCLEEFDKNANFLFGGAQHISHSAFSPTRVVIYACNDFDIHITSAERKYAEKFIFTLTIALINDCNVIVFYFWFDNMSYNQLARLTISISFHLYANQQLLIFFLRLVSYEFRVYWIFSFFFSLPLSLSLVTWIDAKYEYP